MNLFYEKTKLCTYLGFEPRASGEQYFKGETNLRRMKPISLNYDYLVILTLILAL